MGNREFNNQLRFARANVNNYVLFLNERICPVESAVNNFRRNAYDVKPMKNFKKVVI